MHKQILNVIVTLLATLAFSTNGNAAGKTNLMMIVDASGSMWGQIDGKAKITIAKEAMNLIVKDLPQDINIGLVAYGHRRKGDCDDVETLIPLKPLDKKTFLGKVNELNPKGKTPMVRSIRKTAEAIKHLEDETTILLVSDGKETCDPDPCNFVKELEQLGINFVLHVVGFDVGGVTEEQLKCMADAGKGEYFPAKDANKLKHALDTVVEKAVANNLIITPLDAQQKPLSVMINIINENGKIIATDGGKRVAFSLPAGTYTLEINPDTLTEKMTVEGVVVTENEVTKQQVVFAQSNITVSIKDGNGDDINGYIRVIDLNSNQSAEEGEHTGKQTDFDVSPGKYLIDTECSNTNRRIKSEPFTLQPGENKKVDSICANVKIGVLVTGKDEKPISAYVRIVDVDKDVYADEADSTNTMRFFEVPPGKYKVDVECPGEERIRGEVFTIQQGQENQVTLNCATKKIKASLPSESTKEMIKQKNTTPAPSTTSSENSLPQALQDQQDAEKMAAQMEASAMNQVQTALTQLQGMQKQPQLSLEQEQHSSNSQTDSTTNNPNDITLPRVTDSQAGYSAKITTPDDDGAKQLNHVGASPTTVDYSNIGARDTGGGLDDIDEQQGHNPYEGMSPKQMQAAFAKDMGIAGPPISTANNNEEFKVGSPLTTKRHIKNLGYRLDSYKQQASAINRDDILNRITTARTNLDILDQKLKERVEKNTLQHLLDQCVLESNAIKISITQAE